MDQNSSHSHWMNLSTFWTSPTEEPLSVNFSMTPASHTMTDITSRSVQKTSGLFNKARVTDGKHLSGIDVKFGSSCEDLDMSELLCGMLSGSFDPLAEESLDSFVDLSEYLLEEPLGGGVIQVSTNENTSNQRPLVLDFDNVVDVVNVTEVSSPLTPDHDYVSKKPRFSSSPVPSTSVAVVEETLAAAPEDKYLERRRKNNIASRRSREIRKQKFADMDSEAERLTAENDQLKIKIEALEKMAKEMKAILISKLAGK